MAMQSWLSISPNSPFSLANIPFGVAVFPESKEANTAIAIGEYALDLATFASNGGFIALAPVKDHIQIFEHATLNDFAALSKGLRRQIREYLQDVLRVDTPYPHVLRDNHTLQSKCLALLSIVEMQLPFQIGGFSDFYGGMNHAVNAGALFRGQNGALTPNYLHLPLAYHGRTSSIVVSGTPVRRPWGQVLEDPTDVEKKPQLIPCQRMDFELELGAFVCGGNQISECIPIDKAEDNIFGFVLLNDWSARDIQRWEYVPLGPFNGKNFATTISPWVVLAEALEPFRKRGLEHPGRVLSYLKESRDDFTYDLNLEVWLTSEKTGESSNICSTNTSQGLVWSFPQMLAHHTISGCPVKPGDLLGSGTISGNTRSSLGCLLEQTLNGREPITLTENETRTWLEDGDEVILRGWAGSEEHGYVGFGDASGVLLPAHEHSK